MQNIRHTIYNLIKETESTLRFFYILKKFRILISNKKDVDKINENVYFWLLFEASVRTNLFIGIRRLYEGKSDTFNFNNFISECIDNIEEYTKESLRERKIQGSSNANEWIDNYMKEAYEPTVDDFKGMARLVRDNSKKMRGIYTNAASRIYVHAIHMDHTSITEITDQLKFDEIEEALLSIWHCYEQVWQMYENGREPIFNIGRYPYEQEVYESLEKQLHQTSIGV